MKVVIIRHGKVNMRWKKWYTSKQYDIDCANYDLAEIVSIGDLQKSVSSADIYISTLKRSHQTAEQLFGERGFIETDLLNEVPLSSFCDCNIPLPIWLWNVLGRLQWLWQSRRQKEKRTDTQKRAKQLMEELLEKDRDCILVSHGFFMRILVKEFKKQGFVIEKSGVGIANLVEIKKIVPKNTVSLKVNGVGYYCEHCAKAVAIFEERGDEFFQ